MTFNINDSRAQLMNRAIWMETRVTARREVMLKSDSTGLPPESGLKSFCAFLLFDQLDKLTFRQVHLALKRNIQKSARKSGFTGLRQWLALVAHRFVVGPCRTSPFTSSFKSP
jgi:hypothetical protein